jgi:iron complex outermembrane recepter protein
MYQISHPLGRCKKIRASMPIHAFSFSPLRPVAGAAALLCALSAAAQTAPATPSTPETPAAEATLPTVSVRSAVGTADLLQLPASANVLEGRELQDRQMQVNLSEALGSVPGLTLNNRNNYAQDLQLSVRGYGARSTFGVRGVRLYVDGIPATMARARPRMSISPAWSGWRCCAARIRRCTAMPRGEC